MNTSNQMIDHIRGLKNVLAQRERENEAARELIRLAEEQLKRPLFQAAPNKVNPDYVGYLLERSDSTGNFYRVNLYRWQSDDTCECADFKYRQHRCKHINRARARYNRGAIVGR